MDPRQYALRLIKNRLRSCSEIEEALRRKSIPEEQIKEVAAEFIQLRLLDDYAYSIAWMHTRDRLSPRSSRVVEQELRHKGVSLEVIKQARLQVEGEEEAIDEDERARQILSRKEGRYAHLSGEVRLRRQMALLQRRGFSYEVIRRILDT